MSVLRINNNIVALNANRNLRVTGSQLAKSLERLSSGLRINRAADDAAGLSISENLRSQIRGLNRASANALDGISLIQTAEGALNEVTNILQRMRELAVQAANGVLTANDRIAIQQEINQLIDEIDRIASTTEFNTRKLLDGTLGALISTDDPTKLRAAVVGNVGKGGNFILNKQVVDVGQLQVQKTDVFTTIQQQDAVGTLNFLTTYRAEAKFANGATVGSTGITEMVVDPRSTNTLTGKDATFQLRADANGETLNVTGGGLDFANLINVQNLNSGDKFQLIVSTASGLQTFEVIYSTAAGGVGSNVFNTVASFAAALSNAASTVVNYVSFQTGQFRLVLSNGTFKGFKFVDGSLDTTAQSAGVQNASKVFLSFVSLASSSSFASNILFSSADVRFQDQDLTINGGVPQLVSNTAGDELLYVRLATNVLDMGLISGSTSFLGYSTGGNTKFISAANFYSVRAGRTDTIVTGKDIGDPAIGPNQLVKFGQVVQVSTVATDGTFLISSASETTYAVFQFDNTVYNQAIIDGKTREQAISLAKGNALGYSINGTFTTVFDVGEIFNGDLAKVSAGSTENPLTGVRIRFDAILQAGETATFNVSTNNVLTADQATTLGSISRFQEFGVFNGRDNLTFQIFVKGQNRSVTINVTKSDTLETLAGKISLALADPSSSTDLNLEGGINFDFAPDLVHVNTIGVAKGTISITTPVPGTELVIAGDENFLKALSLIEIQDAKAPIYSITATNVESGEVVGTVKTDSNEINGLLPGLKIFFDPTVQLTLDPYPPTGNSNDAVNSNPFFRPDTRPVLSITTATDSEFIHVAPRGFRLQIGPNQGQSIDTFLRDLSSEALGVAGLLVVTEDLASEAISRVSEALTAVSSERSRLGAIQNRLESTIRNLDIAAENLTASESRIRDVDVAQETVEATRLQILLQAGTAALAQANQLPQAVLQLLR